MEMPALSISLSGCRKGEYNLAVFHSAAFCRHWECISEIATSANSNREISLLMNECSTFNSETCKNTLLPLTLGRMQLKYREGVGVENQNHDKLISIGLMISTWQYRLWHQWGRFPTRDLLSAFHPSNSSPPLGWRCSLPRAASSIQVREKRIIES